MYIRGDDQHDAGFVMVVHASVRLVLSRSMSLCVCVALRAVGL